MITDVVNGFFPWSKERKLVIMDWMIKKGRNEHHVESTTCGVNQSGFLCRPLFHATSMWHVM
jgi:hypothetical protein